MARNRIFSLRDAKGRLKIVAQALFPNLGILSTGTPTSSDYLWWQNTGGEDFKATFQDALPAWQTWTPTITQSVGVTATVLLAEYKLDHRGLCHVRVNLQITSAGTGANAISIGGQPSAMQPAHTGNYSILGHGLVVDSGTAFYPCAVYASGAAIWRFYAYGGTSYVGVTPNFALANNDYISFVCNYRV